MGSASVFVLVSVGVGDDPPDQGDYGERRRRGL